VRVVDKMLVWPVLTAQLTESGNYPDPAG